mmetsp:Transcript_24645/g.52533  ORF Transcript_24645/g.52533 Transcript_24645/m.52533 type:complete len:194 (-) Transcript_24645:98-679(-)
MPDTLAKELQNKAQEAKAAAAKAKAEAEAKALRSAVEYLERRCHEAAAAGRDCVATVFDRWPYEARQCRTIEAAAMAALESGGCTVKYMPAGSENGGGYLAHWTIHWEQPVPCAASAQVGNVRGACPVCYETTLLVSLVPCGHSICAGCRGKAATPECPSCRGAVTQWIPMFVDGVVGSETPSKKMRTDQSAE